jgi:hypothetical protein
MKIKFSQETREKLLNLRRDKGVYIEGNIIKLIDYSDDEEMGEYVKEAIKFQKEIQRKRLDITKKVQYQNLELIKAKEEIERINEDLEEALKIAESAKDDAIKDLDHLQKKTQFELIATIVKVSLIIIIGVGISTTILYAFSIVYEKDTQLIGNTWSSMFGILLTNAFSIIGTVMGIKYAAGSKQEDRK